MATSAKPAATELLDDEALDEPLDDELADDEFLEVERLPDLGGWETFKGLSSSSGDERFTVALRLVPGSGGDVEYAYFAAEAAGDEPTATGLLRGARAVRELAEADRERLVLAILARHDEAYGAEGTAVEFHHEPPDLTDDDAHDDDDARDDDAHDD